MNYFIRQYLLTDDDNMKKLRAEGWQRLQEERETFSM